MDVDSVGVCGASSEIGMSVLFLKRNARLREFSALSRERSQAYAVAL